MSDAVLYGSAHEHDTRWPTHAGGHSHYEPEPGDMADWIRTQHSKLGIGDFVSDSEKAGTRR